MTDISKSSEQNEMMFAAAPASKNLRWVFFAFIWFLGAITAALIIYPMTTILVQTFVGEDGLTLAPLAKLSGIRGIGTIVRNTAIYTIGSLFFGTLIGTAMAWINERTDARMKFLAGLLPIVPLMIPSIGSAIGYFFLFTPQSGVGNVILRWVFDLEGSKGPINILNMGGMIYLTSLHLAPLAYLIVSAALRNIDPALDEASRVSGASPLMTLRRVTLPVILPALAGAALIVGIHAIASFIVPFIIGTSAGLTTIPVYIYRLFSSYPPNQSQAMALSLCVLAIVYVAVLLQMRVTNSLRRSVVGGKQSAPTLVRLAAWRWPVRAFLFLYVGAVFVPVLGLVVGAFQPFLGAPPSAYSFAAFSIVLGNPDTHAALINSVVLGALTATATVIVSALLIYGSSSRWRHGRRFIELVMVTPSVIPNIVIAVAFLVTYSSAPFYLYGSLFLIFLAFFTIYIPDASRAASAALSQVNEELSEASYISGAGLVRTLWKVILPQAANGLLAGWVIVFFFAVNEVTASAFLGGPTSQVIGKVTIDYYGNGRLSQVAAISLLVTGITAVVVMMTTCIVSRAYSQGSAR